MKSLILFSSLLIVLLFFERDIANCQWQPEVRLTNDNLESIISQNNAKCIVSSSNIVHVVWASGAAGDWDLFYKRSTDEGMTWGPNVILTTDPGNDGSVDPCIAVSGSFVCVAWTDLRFRPNWEIYFKSSTDGGLTWGSNKRLTDDNSMSKNPSIAINDSVVHLVWSEAGNAYYKRSTDIGVTWNFGIQLSNTSLTNGNPSVSVSGSNVYAVWSENNEIYNSHSTDAGVNWLTNERLTYDDAVSWCPSVSVSGQFVGVVWYDLRDGNYEIYFKHSSDGGNSWGADIRLSNGAYASYNPSVFASGSIIHVALYEIYYDYKLYYKKTTDGGKSWSINELLTNTSAATFNPSLSVSDSVVHVVWYDTRHSNSEIYYKRDQTGGSLFTLSLTAIIEGFYNSNSNYMVPDTVNVYLRNNFLPYTILDSSQTVLNSSGTGVFHFCRINNGINYYFEFRHRNSIETWSSSGNSFSSEILNYDFSTDANKAFGNNMAQVDFAPVRYAIFSGDVNQDGAVDVTDMSSIDNDAYNFSAGYLATDIDGNDFVDLSDYSIADNNAFNFVSKVTP